uniref:Lipocalin/cytosolic fatty-acid binding domain-containing protein n=1 Tax=Amblyomma maculatum TaxID=34609 RepID=G3MR49_AMBMU
MSRKIVLGWLFVSLFSITNCADAGEKKTPDLKAFLNRNKKIWVYEASDTSNLQCIVDVQKSLSAEEVTFRRHYRRLSAYSYYDLKGKFVTSTVDQAEQSKKTYNKMEVSLYQTTPRKFSQETLLYLSNDEICGVFFVVDLTKDTPRSWYDIRLSDTSIASGPDQACLNFYDAKRQGTTSRKIYYPDCNKNPESSS